MLNVTSPAGCGGTIHDACPAECNDATEEESSMMHIKSLGMFCPVTKTRVPPAMTPAVGKIPLTENGGITRNAAVTMKNSTELKDTLRE
jgi:hypothetical protein